MERDYKIVVEACSSLRDALERLGRAVAENARAGYDSFGTIYVQQAGCLWVVWKEMDRYPPYPEENEPRELPY